MAIEFPLTIELGRPDDHGKEFGKPSKVTLSKPRKFTFLLCSKDIRVGDRTFRQLWMPHRTVCAQGKKLASNRAPVLDHFYWDGCRTLSVFDEDYLAALILAHLFRHARAYGSRRVFLNSLPTKLRNDDFSERELLKRINTDLVHSRSQEMEPEQFKARVGKILGPKSLPKELQTQYVDFKKKLVAEVIPELNQIGQDALRRPITEWKKWMKTLARSGNESELSVLDYISYEASAAFNRAYAVAFSNIIRYLHVNERWTEEEVHFNSLWHGEAFLAPSGAPPMDWFQGHVFALHPACGYFLRTATGCEMIADRLANPNTLSYLHRLLNGICIALYHYKSHFEAVAEERRRRTNGSAENIDDSLDNDAQREWTREKWAELESQ